MLVLVSVLSAVTALLLVLKLSQRLTLRLRVLAGVSLSRPSQKSCPHLGLAIDPFTHQDKPTDEHRCYLWMQRDRIDLVHQKGFCLTAAHHKCPWLMVRRPDATPPLHQRLPAFGRQVPAQVWALACSVGSALAALGSLPLWGRVRNTAGVQAGTSRRKLAVAAARLGGASANLLVDKGGRAGALAVRFVRTYGPPAARWTGRTGLLLLRLGGRGLLALALGLWWLARHAAWLLQAGLLRLVAALRQRQAQAHPKPVPAVLNMAAQADAEPAPIKVEPVAAAAQGGTLQTLKDLLDEGVRTLDAGQEALAYHLFVKASEHTLGRAESAFAGEHAGLLVRAWFWRAKTAETVEEVVRSLEKALQLDPDNLQMQAHLAWAKQRLEREQKLQTAADQQQPVPAVPYQPPAPPRPALASQVGTAVRVLGGLAALALAVLWMTAGLMPALGRTLAGMPPADQQLVHQLLLTINGGALPGKGHLPLPVVGFDLGLSLPFVLAFLFVFTGRGLMDGDTWARRSGLLLAAAGGWLCLEAVSNPQAARLGLVLCAGIIVAVFIGRFEPPARFRQGAGY